MSGRNKEKRMNGMIKKSPINSELLFMSDVYANKVFEKSEKIEMEINRLIEENAAVMFSWKPDRFTRIKTVFFPYKDNYGIARAVKIVNGEPRYHTTVISEAVKDITYAVSSDDVYYKTC